MEGHTPHARREHTRCRTIRYRSISFSCRCCFCSINQLSMNAWLVWLPHVVFDYPAHIQSLSRYQYQDDIVQSFSRLTAQMSALAWLRLQGTRTLLRRLSQKRLFHKALLLRRLTTPTTDLRDPTSPTSFSVCHASSLSLDAALIDRCLCRFSR